MQRFGFVTTNSITQLFSRRVVARHLDAKQPLSIIMAIPDHPWTKATDDHASVRIAMTVVMAGKHDGVVREVANESGLDTGQHARVRSECGTQATPQRKSHQCGSVPVDRPNQYEQSRRLWKMTWTCP